MRPLKRISRTFCLRETIAYLLVFCMVFNNSLPLVLATPSGADVAAGIADITQAGNTTSVNMTSSQAVINWSSLDTAAAETLQFLKASGNFAVLNRVLQGGATQFDGTLLGNQGNIFIVNTRGIVFGPTAYVQATQLVASALDIQNSDFMKGIYQFAGGNGAVINQGRIIAENAALIGQKVLNTGTITALNRIVALVAGDSVLLGQPGSKVVVEVTGVTQADLTDADFAAGDVINKGSIDAQGGTIVLAAGDIFSKALDVESKALKVDGGIGTVAQLGTVSAGSGSISLTAGDEVVLGPGSLTSANAGQNGDGGEIIAYSTGTTALEQGAQIQAKGGSESGDGGFVEISGEHFTLAGALDLSAENGSAGSLFIDPVDLTVADGSNLGAADTVYEEDVELLSQAGVDVIYEAEKTITFEDIDDDEITGGSGDLTFLTTTATDSYIRFLDPEYDSITTTTGDITMVAGSGGIDIGNLISGSLDQTASPGEIKLYTLNGGDIDTGYLYAFGGSDALVSAVAAGDLTINAAGPLGGMAAAAVTNAEPPTLPGSASAQVCLQAEGDIDVLGGIGAGAYAETTATADIHVCAGGAVTISGSEGFYNQVTALAVVTNPLGSADATIQLHAGDSVSVYRPGESMPVQAIALVDDDYALATSDGTADDEDTVGAASALIDIEEEFEGECPDCPRPPVITQTITVTDTQTATETQTTTITETGTATQTATDTQTITTTETCTDTQTATDIEIITVTETVTVTQTATGTGTTTKTETATATQTATDIQTITVTETVTATQTATGTQTITTTETVTVTQTATGTGTTTITETATATQTATDIQTITVTETGTATQTATDTQTITKTETVTITQTATDIQTITITETATATQTATDTQTMTITETVTRTETILVIDDGGGGTVPDPTTTPLTFVILDGARPTGEAVTEGIVYEEEVEQTSVDGVHALYSAWNSITVEDISDDEILGGAGNLTFITIGGDGFISFDDKTDTIRTTTGDIILIAGGGGIDIGNLETGKNNQPADPGLIYLYTINGGDITTGYLNSLGGKNALVSVISAGDLTITGDTSHGAVRAQTNTADEPGPASAEICLQVGGDVGITYAVEAKAHGKYETTANIHICADGKIQVDAQNGQIYAWADTAESTGTADAFVKIHAGSDATDAIVITKSGSTDPVRAHANAGSGNAVDETSSGAVGDDYDETDGTAHLEIEIADDYSGECPDCPDPGVITQTITVTDTQTATATETITKTETGTVTQTATDTQTITKTETGTATQTATDTETITKTETGTVTQTATATQTITVTETGTATQTATATQTITVTETGTATQTATDTETVTRTETGTVTQTATATETITVTETGTVTQTATDTRTITITETGTATRTATDTQTVTVTETITVTRTATGTETITKTETTTVTQTATGTETVTRTETTTRIETLIDIEVETEITKPAEPLYQQQIPVISGCPVLLTAAAAEVGIPSDTLQISIEHALASRPNIHACEACSKLVNYAAILRDTQGDYLASLVQVFNEIAPPDAPFTPEMAGTIATVFADRLNDPTAPQYAMASEFVDALVGYIAVLDTDLGSPVGDSTAFVMDKYGTNALQTDNPNITSYIQMRLEGLGG